MRLPNFICIILIYICLCEVWVGRPLSPYRTVRPSYDKKINGLLWGEWLDKPACSKRGFFLMYLFTQVLNRINIDGVVITP